MEKPLSAVFITEVSSVTVPMLARWANSGHRIAAVVVPGPRAGKRLSFSTLRRRLRRRFALRSHFGHTVPALIEFSPPYDWDRLGREFISASGADLLICFGYGRLIPQTALELFPNGGLNFHPALLPHYRGPHPIHRLVIDQMHDAHGGVTLHKMTSGFDEGDILAQVGFAGEDWHSAATVNRALADAMAVLAADIAPEFCRGRLAGLPQPDGAYVWARIEPGPLIVGTRSSSEHVARLCRIVGSSVPVNVLIDGRPVRLAQPIRSLGPPTGEAARCRWGLVEFDCADARVVHLAYNRLSRLLLRRQSKLRPAGREQRSFDIRRFGLED
jgi:methionyl-tRNA formyltransferase